MANVLFISENWLKDNTPLTQNIDIQELYPFFIVAQDIWVQDKVGSKLYDRLKDGVTNNNLNSDEITLIQLLRPSLAYYIAFEALPFLAVKIRNIGVVETADNKQKNAERADRKELRQEILNKAEYYMERVNDYLCHNGKLFPEYVQPNCDLPGNKASGYTCELYLDPYFNIDNDWIRKNYRNFYY